MKQPKALTRSEKERLSSKHLDPDKYVKILENAEVIIFQKKEDIGSEHGQIILKK